MSNFGHLRREVERLKRDLERHDDEPNSSASAAMRNRDWYAKRAAIVDAIEEAEEEVKVTEEAIRFSSDK